MKRKRILIPLILVAGAGLAIYAGAFRSAAPLEGSGTVQARNIRVGSKVGRRIAAVKVREGDAVEAG